jgi:membrane protease YdiL (CAAX protease family)
VIPGTRGSEAPEPFPPPTQAFFLVAVALAVRVMAALLFTRLLPPGPSVLGMSAIVGLGGAFAVGAAQLTGSAADHLGFRRPPALVTLAVPLLVPWVLLVSELDNFARGVLPAFPEPPSTGEPPSGPFWFAELALSLALAVPVCEELFFRGLLQPGLVTRLGRARGALLVAGLGALVALPVLEPRSMLFAAALALPLCLLREAGGSLWPALALHACFGAVAVGAELGAFGIPGFDDMSAGHTPLRWLVPAAASALAGFGICALALRRERG